MNRYVTNFIIVMIMVLQIGCSATPPKQEIMLPSQDLNNALSENSTKLIIFNDSNKVLYGIDGSGKINLHLNGKGVGQLRIGEYVIIDIQPGGHVIDLLHRDIFSFSSSHDIKVEKDKNTFIKIYAKVTSNGLEIVEKPDDFEDKYSPAY